MEEQITIKLTKEQRDLLLEYKSSFTESELFRFISVAVKKGKEYEISLTQDQLGDLLDQITDIQDLEENEKKQDRLEDLWEYFDSCFDLFQEDEEDEDDYDDSDYSEYSRNEGLVWILKVALDGDTIWRKIAIRGGQTLHNLHYCVFDAFDREEDHMYSFFFPHVPLKILNTRKLCLDSKEYIHPYACESLGAFSSDKDNGAKTTIQSLNLSEGQVFYYLFDFGDQWWHEITVEQTEEPADSGDYPRVIKRQGQSPEQYEYPDDDDS